MTGLKPSKARTEALAVADELEAQVARWAEEKATAESELAELQASAGEKVLADPDASSDVVRGIQVLRDKADIAARTTSAAEAKLDEARREVLRIGADEWDAEAGTRRKALDAHEAKVAELLAALEEFGGRRYHPVHVPDDLPVGTIVETGVDKGLQLRHGMERAEVRAQILRAVADGRDHEPILTARQSIHDGKIAGVTKAELMPDLVWGPSAVMPLPGHASMVAAAQQRIDEHDTRVEQMQETLEHWDLQLEGRGFPAHPSGPNEVRPSEPEYERLKRDIAAAPAQRRVLEEQLAAATQTG